MSLLGHVPLRHVPKLASRVATLLVRRRRGCAKWRKVFNALRILRRMITRRTQSKTEGDLVPLICGPEGCYLYGDPTERVVDATPLEPPWTVVAISTATPLSLVVQAWAASPARPPEANAFYMGMPAFRYASRYNVYDVSVQYCRIDEDECERSRTFEQPEQLSSRLGDAARDAPGLNKWQVVARPRAFRK